MPRKPTYGDHEGHNVQPHDHHAQPRDRARANWCSGKWWCLTCTRPGPGGRPLRGAWFDGPKCGAPEAA